MRGRLFRLSLLAMGISLLLSGCAAQHSIFRNRTVRANGPSIITVDAKQRAYLAVPPLPAAGVNPAGAARQGQIRICAEPPPDFASVIAQSLSASGSFGQSADPQSVQAAASLAQSSSEQGTTIARTQTINMLRELMYRTCERYLNGAINEYELPIQAVRDQRLMIATLAIEQLTGAVTPPTVVIGASGDASAGASSSDAVVRLDDARKRLEAADAAQRSRQTEYDALEGAAPSCTSIETAAAASPPTLTPEQTGKQPDCANALTALNRAKTERTAAAEAYQVLRTAAAGGGAGPASAASAVQSGDHAGNGLSQAQAESVERVAQAVETIVTLNYSQDEFGLFCLRFLDPRQPNNEQLRQPCLDYLTAKVQLEAAQASRRAQMLYQADFGASVESLRRFTDPLFEAFRAKVTSNSALDADLLRSVVDRAVADLTSLHGPPPPPIRRRLDQLRVATTEEQLRAAFDRLTPEIKTFLAQ